MLPSLTSTRRAVATIALGALGAGCGTTVTLHAPTIAPATARDSPARVSFEPLVVRPGAGHASGGNGGFAHPDPAAVLTSAMDGELAGRALRGGDPEGTQVRCTLERFALRTTSNMGGTRAYAALYVDLACETARGTDGALVWRGAIRARTASQGGGTFGHDAGMMQRLADQTMSDAARELASDLAVRVLGLEGTASARSFADESERTERAGLDDTPLGAAALEERAGAASAAASAIHDADATVRAAAWNVIAMAAGPDEPWPLGEAFAADEDMVVRFYQYKALARQASPETLRLLQTARMTEDERLLGELVCDSLTSGGIGLRRTKATAATNGATTSP